MVHDAPLAGHMGTKRTWMRLRNSFWWPNMKAELEKYIAGCERCGKNKHINHPNKAPIQSTDIPMNTLDTIQVDFLGPFQAARTHQNRYVLQVQDVFSRYLKFIPCRDNTAMTAAEAVFDEWVCSLCVPKLVTSDHGPHFAAKVFEYMCELAGIKHRMGAPGHARSQGQVERQNQLLNQVRCVCDNDLETWPEAIVRIQAVHNMSVNAATGFAPFSLLTGQSARLPEQLATDTERQGSERSTRLNEEDKALQEIREKERRLTKSLAMAKLAIRNTQIKRQEDTQDVQEVNLIE